MATTLDITDVARLTGLSPRALRFYEARGLVRPLRTAAGRRVFGPAELQRLNDIVVLKRAGFSLTAISGMLGDRPSDLARLVETQLRAVEAQAAALAESRDLLLSIQSRIDRCEPIDVATLCSLIRKGGTMPTEDWKKLFERYQSPEAQAEWSERMAELPAGFDPTAYGERWAELGGRIEAALPLDPRSDQAKAFVREWFALLEPFTRVATPAMWEGSKAMYADMASWEGHCDPGFSSRVWQFVNEAAQAMRADGENVGPLPAHLAE